MPTLGVFKKPPSLTGSQPYLGCGDVCLTPLAWASGEQILQPFASVALGSLSPHSVHAYGSLLYQVENVMISRPMHCVPILP